MGTRRPLIKSGDSVLTEPGPIRVGSDGKVPPEALAVLNLVVLGLIKKINGNLSLGQMVHGQLTGNFLGQCIQITATPSVADTEFEIPHGLTTVPVFFWYFLDRAGDLYASNFNSWNKDRLLLRCSVASAAATIVVF